MSPRILDFSDGFASSAPPSSIGGGSSVIAPAISSVTPAPGNLTSLSGSIVVAFTEAMNTGSTGAGIGNTANWTLASSAGSISISSIVATGTSATINYTSSGITSGTTITLTASGAIQSSTGLGLVGILTAGFTYLPTATNPTITSFSPASGNVSTVPTTVTVTFSQAMDPGTTQNVANWTASSTIGAVSVTAVSLSGSVATVTLSTSGVTSGAQITLSATASILSNVGSLPVTGSLSDTLTYVPPTGPSVLTFSPPSGRTITSLPVTVTVNFSQAMNTANTGGGLTNPANWTVAASSGSASITGISATSSSATLTIAGSGISSGGTITLTALTSLLSAAGVALTASAQDVLTYNPAGLVLPTPATPTVVGSTYACRGQGGGGAFSNYSMSAFNGLTFSGCDGGQLIRSPDGINFFPCPQSVVGVNSNFPSYPAMSVGFASDGATCYYAQGGTNPQRSTDGGITWPAMTSLSLTGGEKIKYWCIDSYNPQVLFCGTTANLYGSVNGGTTWTLVKAGAAMGTFIQYTNATTRNILHATGTTIWMGISWTIASGISSLVSSLATFYTAGGTGIRMFTGGQDSNGVTLAFVDTDSSAAAAQSPAVNYTGNFGYVWTSPGTAGFSKSTQGGGLFLRMAENDSQTIYTCGGSGSSNQEGSKIWVSRNGGSTWSLVFWELNQTVSPFAPWPADKLEYNSPGIDLQFPWSDDAPRTLEINLRNSAQVSFSNNFFCFRSDNYGANWKSPFTIFKSASGSDTTSGSFTMPTSGSTVTITLASGDNSWLSNAEYVFIAGAGYFQVTSFPASNQVTLTACGGKTFTCTLTSGSNVLASPSSLVGLMPGLRLNGTGIPAGGTFIATVTPTLTMTAGASANTSGGSLTASGLDKYVLNTGSGTTIPSGAAVIPARLTGMRWSSTGLENTTINRIKFHPANNAVAFLACSDQAGLVTRDGGVSFMNCGSMGINAVYDYAFDPTDSAALTIWACGGDLHDWTHYGGDIQVLANSNGATSPAGGVWYSTNGGISWVSLTGSTYNMQFLSVAYYQPTTTLYAGMQGGGVITSTNNGTTWTAMNSGLPTSSTQSLIISQIEVDPTNGNVYCLVSGNAGEIKAGGTSYSNHAQTGVYFWDTVNGATSWSLLRTTVTQPTGTSSTLWNYPVRFALDYTTRSAGKVQTIWMADIQVNGSFLVSGVWKTTNAGTLWTQSIQNLYPHDLIVDSTNSRVYCTGLWNGAGSGNGGCLVTKDGGTTWAQNMNLPLTSTAVSAALDPNASNRIFYGFLIGGLLYGPRPA